MELKNNTILITGGSSGIGLELARQQLPSIHTFQSDVSRPEAIQDLSGPVRMVQQFLPWLRTKNRSLARTI